MRGLRDWDKLDHLLYDFLFFDKGYYYNHGDSLQL